MDAKELTAALDATLTYLDTLIHKDQLEVIEGHALASLDLLITEAKNLLPDHPIVSQVSDLISPEAVAGEAEVYAKDLRFSLGIIAEAVRAKIPKPRAQVFSPDYPPKHKREMF